MAQTKVDESLYSRQLYAIGKDTMTSLINGKVLIINLDPLAVEICKNIILCGIGFITICDNKKISDKDYGNYYISEKDFNKNRADIIGSRLSELNPNVKITKYSGDITTKLLSKFNIVIFIDYKFDDTSFNLNDFCRNNNIKTIFTSSRGFMGYIFCDFGNYKTNDIDGEKLKSGYIVSYDNIKCITDKHHHFEVGNKFKFLNSDNIYEVKKIINPNSFETDKNIDNIGEYIEIKNIININFKSLKKSILKPEFIHIDFSDFDIPNKLHQINCSILQDKLNNLNLKDDLTSKIYNSYDGQLVPLNSIIGGIVANNIISGIANKYTPIKQWLYYECTNIINDIKNIDYNYNDIYKNQVKVIGSELQKKINDYKLFIVGSGALGCEYLKNFSMMGIGKQIITDMDIIEKSNLNRQFLFRNNDIGKYKSDIATKKAQQMNNTINIEYKLNKVGIETENIFDYDFYKNIDCIVNALDNVNARIYMDNQTIAYNKPLLEAGTLGLKGNVQVILPNLTESYQSSSDKTEESIPLCTIKNFPYEISHCIQWAREQFESLFVIPFQTYMNLKNIKKDKLDEYLNKIIPTELINIKDNLEYIDNYKNMYNDFYNTNYRQKIYDLINKYPEDYITNEGEKFWSGTKKYPKIIDFDITNEICIKNKKSYQYILKSIFNRDIQLLNNINQELLNKIEKTEDINNKDIIEYIKQFILSTEYDFNVIEFEKDDDTNGHIEFITSSANLRAMNYSIKTVSEFETKGIAGNIIPALATTTSIVSGLLAIELYKVISKDKYKLEYFKNTFLSLGISFIGSSEPIQCKYKKLGNLDISLWTNLKYNNITIKELLDIFNNDYNVNINQILYNDKTIYTEFMNKDKIKNIINKNILDITKNDKSILTLNISDDSNDSDDSDIINITIIK